MSLVGHFGLARESINHKNHTKQQHQFLISFTFEPVKPSAFKTVTNLRTPSAAISIANFLWFDAIWVTTGARNSVILETHLPFMDILETHNAQYYSLIFWISS